MSKWALRLAKSTSGNTAKSSGHWRSVFLFEVIAAAFITAFCAGGLLRRPNFNFPPSAYLALVLAKIVMHAPRLWVKCDHKDVAKYMRLILGVTPKGALLLTLQDFLSL